MHAIEETGVFQYVLYFNCTYYLAALQDFSRRFTPDMHNRETKMYAFIFSKTLK
jgi:hypothetical protein